MNAQKLKQKRAERRRYRVRKDLYGTPEKPRLSVLRSNLHISAQLIDDLNGVTLAAATSAGKKSGLKHGGKRRGGQGGRQEDSPRRPRPRGSRVAPSTAGRSASTAASRRWPSPPPQAGLVCTGLEVAEGQGTLPRPKPPRRVKGEGKPKGEEGRRKAQG